jgi:predicted membrane protein
MKIFLLIFTLLHLLTHVIGSVVMTYHMWHMHKFHGRSKWKVLMGLVWAVICIATMVELPDMIHDLSHKCG